MATAHIQLSIDPASPQPGIEQLMKHLRPDWSQINVKPFNAGLTNDLFGVFHDQDEEFILARVHGQGSDLFIDRKRELRILEILAKYGVCQPIHASFENGLCYGYVAGTVFDNAMIRDGEKSGLVAKEMARLHTVPVPEEFITETGNVPSILRATSRMIDMLPENYPMDQEQYEKVVQIDKLREGVRRLELLSASFNEELVFCHHDLFNPNLIYNAVTDRVHFIDFEYCGPSLASIEISCFFIALMGMGKSHDRKYYPNKDFQLQFLRIYLLERNRYLKVGVEVTSEMLELWYGRVRKMSLVTDLFWGIWNLLQSIHNDHQYCFMEMGFMEIDKFLKTKDQVLAA